MDLLIHAVRAAVRSVRHTPGFTATVVLILGLGIGLSTAVFTIAHTLLLRPLPVTDQDRIVSLWTETASFKNYPFTVPDARLFARESATLERVALFTYEGAWPAPLRDGDRVLSPRMAPVSGNFFEVLGSRPIVGRSLQPSDDMVGAAPVAVLSSAAWQKYFAGDSAVIGRQVTLHVTGASYTIVGVMPPGLAYPRGTEMWVPLAPLRTRPGAAEPTAYVDLVGRMKPGMSAGNVAEELDRFTLRASDFMSNPAAKAGVVTPFRELTLGETRPALIAFTAAATLLLLITCLNVANLLVSRGLARVREVAVRAALGARRSQVAIQLLAENALLAIGGGALGLLVATMGISAFREFAAGDVPRLDEIGVNGVALAAAAVVTAIAMLLFGTLPAIATSGSRLETALRAASHRATGRRARAATEWLAGGQMAVAVLVLSGAGLVSRTLVSLERADLSFEPSRLLLAELSIRADAFDTRDKQVALLERIMTSIEATPGVVALSPVVAPPFSGFGGWDGRPATIGQSEQDAAENPMLNMDVVTPGYFATFAIPVLRGRGFTAADREGAPHVVVLSESAARHFWPGKDPVGQRLWGAGDTTTVIGIVPDTRYRELRDARASMYFPLGQSPFPYAPTTIAIRTLGAPSEAMRTIRSAIAGAGTSIVVTNLEPFDSYLDKPLAQPRLNALLLSVFAVSATVLAAMGLFTVIALMVAHRRREIGIRMALGATSPVIRLMLLARGLVIACGGLGAGLGAAFVANRYLEGILFGITPADPGNLATTAVILLAVALAAVALPARRGTSVDPVTILRAEA